MDFQAISLDRYGYALSRQLSSSRGTAVLLVKSLWSRLPNLERGSPTGSVAIGAEEQSSWSTPEASSEATTAASQEKEESPEFYVVKTHALNSFDARGQRAALEEIKLLKSLKKHPHVIRYIESWWNGVGPSSGRLTVVMEHAEDGDLRAPGKAMQRSKRWLPESLVRMWLRQMLDGLKFLHSRDVVHRDLKPSNVFLKDKWCTSLLGDFGISIVVNKLRFSSSCVGTPAYMAPETVRNEPCSTAVDLWGLGATLYELLALRTAFLGTSLLSLVYKITSQEIEEQPLEKGGYSTRLVHLVQQLMVKDPLLRPSAAGVLDADGLWEGYSADESRLQALDVYSQSFDLTSEADGGASTNGTSLVRRACSSDASAKFQMPEASVQDWEDTWDSCNNLSPSYKKRGQQDEVQAAENEEAGATIRLLEDEEQTAQTLSADEILREELNRTRESDVSITQDALDGMLKELAAASGSGFAWDAATGLVRDDEVDHEFAGDQPGSSPKEEDPVDLMNRTEMFLRRHGLGTSFAMGAATARNASLQGLDEDDAAAPPESECGGSQGLETQTTA